MRLIVENYNVVARNTATPSQRRSLLSSCRSFLIERSGAPTATPTEPQHGTGDPKEPAAREPTGKCIRTGERYLRTPVKESGKKRCALLARPGCTAEDHPASQWRCISWDRSSRRSHANSFRNCSSARQSLRRKYARSQLDRNK